MRTITNKHAIAIENLTFSRGEHTVLQNVNLKISVGEHVALLGANGSGKSTLLELIIGTLKLDSGKISTAGRVAFVPQRSAISDSIPMTVLDVVEMGRWAHLKKWQRLTKVDHDVVRHHMERLKIVNLAGRELSELSGGQRQRTLIARALAEEAPILLLDEPEAGLDAEAAEIISSVLTEEAQKGTTVLIATHDLGSAKKASRCIVLSVKDKNIAADGPPDKTLSDSLVARTFAH